MMNSGAKWNLANDEKERLISELTDELITLRTKANISQSELSNLIGISRQSYGSIERKTRRMTWNTYLSLIFFYDYNKKTHKLLHSLGAFPHNLIKQFNDGVMPGAINLEAFLGDMASSVMNALDEQAYHSIRTLIMVEFARCTETPGDVIVKSFDGANFNFKPLPSQDTTVLKALHAIKGDSF